MNRYLLCALANLMLFFAFSCSSDSEDPTPEPDVTAPKVDFSISGAPSNVGSGPIVVSNQIQVNINAQDAGGVAKVEAFINDQKVGEDNTSPYQITIDLSGYTSKNSLTAKFQDYVLKVTVTDTSGNATSEQQVIHIDNELPSITEVSLQEGQIIGGETNTITFNVIDNEGLSSVKCYAGERFLMEITDNKFEVNINTLHLTYGENIFKIEAFDLAENKTTYETVFYADNSGPTIELERLIENPIIDEVSILSPMVIDEYSEVMSVEFLVGEDSQTIIEKGNPFQWEIDPDSFNTGSKFLYIKAKDSFGNESINEFPMEIMRRLIVVNIPEDRLTSDITVPIIFISLMDGSLVTYKEFSRDDRQIVLNTYDDFPDNTEFMLSFYLQSYTGHASISTHQNLTKNNPEVLTLAEPKRKWAELGNTIKIPIANFFSQDQISSRSGRTVESYLWNYAPALYEATLNHSENTLDLWTDVAVNDNNPFSSFYVYDHTSDYRYLILENPIDENYVLDKENFTTENLEDKTLAIQLAKSDAFSYYFRVYGASTYDDKISNKYHEIYNSGGKVFSLNSLDYKLNSMFQYYRHTLFIDNFYLESNGPPPTSYEVPNLSFSYTYADGRISLDVQGTEHIVGRIRCATQNDNTSLYNWSITFDSQKTQSLVLPDLPPGITHEIRTRVENNNVEVSGVELISYEGITSYDEYIQKVTKNQANVLDVSNWYKMIKSTATLQVAPTREFMFN